MKSNAITGLIIAAGAALIAGTVYLTYKSEKEERAQEAEADKAAEEFARTIKDPFEQRRYLNTYYENKRLNRQCRRLEVRNMGLETARQCMITSDIIRRMCRDVDTMSRKTRAADADFESIQTNHRAFG